MKKLIVFMFSVILFGSCGSNESNVERAVRKVAEDLNKTCPKLVDEATRLDKVEIDEDGYFHYTFTFPSKSIDDFNVSEFKDIQKRKLNKMYNSNEKFELYRQNDIFLKYSYFDKNKVQITSFTINNIFIYK